MSGSAQDLAETVSDASTGFHHREAAGGGRIPLRRMNVPETAAPS